MCLTALNANAQTEEVNIELSNEPADTTRFNLGETEFIIINHGENDSDTLIIENDSTSTKKIKKKKKRKGDAEFGHWGGFDIGVNNMLNVNGKLYFDNKFLEIDPAESFNFAINFAEIDLKPFKSHHFGFVTGLGFEHSRFGFKNNYALKYNKDSTWATIDTVKNFNKNQLRAWYFHIPLLVQINTSKFENKNIHIEFGVIGGIRMTSKTFQEYDILGGEEENEAKGKYNLNPYKLTATARVGYKSLGLFANYSLTPLFEKDKLEQAFPFTVGLRFDL